MTNNANSVNIESASHGKARYHHGDLRAAVIEAGLELLKIRGVDELSLREIARTVGVSAPAVYRHFPDKQALLSALAREGLRQLAEAQRLAAEKSFAEVGRAYVRFALANPALYRLAFAAMPDEFQPDGAAYEGSSAWLLRKGVAEMLPANATPEKHHAAAIHYWSLVHGLSMLMLDGQVDPDDDLINQVVGETIG
jgi:AcrR family transcriptional regulator